MGETECWAAVEPLIVRWLIQLRLNDGRLPRGRLTDLIKRPGDQRVCDGCGMFITKAQQAVTGMIADDWREIRLHINCFKVWDIERLEDHEYRG